MEKVKENVENLPQTEKVKENVENLPQIEKVKENVENLPRELVENILKRLPYKSLARFKCVCKSWYTILNDPLFLSRHLSIFIKNHNSGHSVLLRLSFPTIFGKDFETYKLFSLSATRADYSAVETLIPRFNMFSTKFHVSGHCNGILCLSTVYWLHSKEVVLYNPATREFRCLPDTFMRSKHATCALAVGMGYDPCTDDYKVIRIWKVDVHGNHGVFSTIQVEEYALSTDSWKLMLNTNAGDFNFREGCFAMFFKNTYYWWAKNLVDNRSVLLALGMEDEVFQRVPMPRQADVSVSDSRSLAVWNDSIALICCSHGITTTIDIWVMDGFGAEGSWTRMQTIQHLEDRPKPLVFWKGNELLMEMSSGISSAVIKSYNVETKKFNDITIKGRQIVRYSSLAVNYVASAVSLNEEGDFLI